MEYSDLVFLSLNGRPIRNSTYHKDLEKVCVKLGIERFSIHTLRHTFATRCIEAGMKPKTLQRILGHANISMTMDLYVHSTEKRKSKRNAEYRKRFKGNLNCNVFHPGMPMPEKQTISRVTEKSWHT